MKPFSLRELSIAGTVALLGACQGAPVAPEKANWTDDVYPIIQGNCAGCHGAQTKQLGRVIRLDFNYDPNNAACKTLAGAVGAIAVNKGLFQDYLRPGKDGPPRMPPAPADPLPDWMIDTINAWDDESWQNRDGNADPRAMAIGVPKTAQTDAPKFFVDVSDDDGDQVVGLVKIDDMDPIKVLGVGRTTVDLSTDDRFSKLSSGKHDVLVSLCDGQSAPDPIKVGTIQKK